MAQDRAGLKIYQDLRDHLEKVEVLAVLELLRSIQDIETKTVPGDEQTSQIERAMRSFLDKTNPFELQKVVTSLQTLPFIRSNGSLRNTWKYFVDVNGDPAGFFTEDNFKNSASLTYLYTYLSLSVSELESQITVISSEIKKEAEEQKQKLSSASSAISASSKQPEKQLSETEIREQNERKIREDQQKSVERAKQAFIRYQAELARINGLLPPGRQLSETDFLNLAKLASDSSFAPLNIDTFFERYGLTRMVGNDKVALSALKQYFISLRYKHLQLRQEQGLSVKVFASEQMQEAVSDLTRVYGDRAVMLAYSATGTQLKEMETKPDGSKDVDVQLAREIRAQSLGTLWQPDKGAVSLIKNFTGQTKRAREEFLRDIGLITDETLVTDRPRLFEEFLGKADNLSVLDMVGTDEEEPVLSFDGEAPAQPTATAVQARDPAYARRQEQRLKQLSQTGKFVAANPAAIGAVVGTAGVGTLIAGIMAQAPGVMAVGGGAIGGTIGFFLGGPVGAAVGAVLGGGVSYLAGKAAFGGPALTLPIGVTSPTLPGIINTLASTVTPTAQATLVGAGTGAGNLANAALASGKAFINALPAIQSPLASAFGSIGVVAGPLVVTSAIAALVVVPAMFGAFLTPEGAGLQPESKYVEVEKTETHSTAGFDSAGNPTTDVPVTYTIKIKPKLSEDGKTPYTITIKDVKDTFRLSSKQQGLTPPTSGIQIAPGPLPAEGLESSYSITLPASFKDTRITNTVTFTFDIEGPENITDQIASAIASIAFGNPPSDIACMKFGEKDVSFDVNKSSEWSETDKQKFIDAFQIMNRYPTYLELLCGDGKEITLYHIDADSRYGYWGLAPGGLKLGFYKVVFKSNIWSIRYVLIHELGHIMQVKNPGFYLRFLQGTGSEPVLETYGFSTSSARAEDFAESFAVYNIYKHYSFKSGGKVDMAESYPVHYSWMKQNVFDGLDAE